MRRLPHAPKERIRYLRVPGDDGRPSDFHSWQTTVKLGRTRAWNLFVRVESKTVHGLVPVVQTSWAAAGIVVVPIVKSWAID